MLSTKLRRDVFVVIVAAVSMALYAYVRLSTNPLVLPTAIAVVFLILAGRFILSRETVGARAGWTGAALLVVSYGRLFGFRTVSPGWQVAVIALSGAALVAFVWAALTSTKWWFFGTPLAVLSATLAVAFAWG